MTESAPNFGSAMQPATVISIRELRTRCSRCSIRELCLPVGLDLDALKQLANVVTTRTRLKLNALSDR